MVCYILDALRYKEGALAAVWLTLGSVNLSLWLSGAVLMGGRPLALSLMIGACSGTLLFTTGIQQAMQMASIMTRVFGLACTLQAPRTGHHKTWRHLTVL